MVSLIQYAYYYCCNNLLKMQTWKMERTKKNEKRPQCLTLRILCFSLAHLRTFPWFLGVHSPGMKWDHSLFCLPKCRGKNQAKVCSPSTLAYKASLNSWWSHLLPEACRSIINISNTACTLGSSRRHQGLTGTRNLPWEVMRLSNA